ncbi:LacI family DNA-binding transcriptional regulator [Actinomadura sp. BRA 177]|uniref:LacI family DNA-binding transcriptional regulator n=1 Tax=Actinomadura sp. BRA 177 TaxID=2745202 RepID=UPI001594F5C2|nr:LacI family DNA-binding transcriptional regulator [Actinomadura sp. BRA 177]NVI91420.1 LacI family DNA-binding transcriptional regulator [Actinomadura sp. BRA 177]
MKRPTLEAVAARAGVSRATVSRVVNGSSTVNPDIRTTVLRAVEELGYVPNSAARSLVTQRTGSIGLVVSEPPARVFSDDPFFSQVIRTVSQELEAADRQVVLMMPSSPGGQARVERYVAGGHVDGVILLSLHGSDPLPAALMRTGVPVVSHGRPVSTARPPYCDVDNVGGARTAMEHLLAKGRRRIATITGPLDMSAGLDRLAGYRETLSGTGRRSLAAMGDFTRESGAAAMQQLLEDDPDLDAVFAASDLMAAGALHTLRKAGRRVPDDVAMVGFDDIDAARFTDPPLTTVRQPIDDVAQTIVRIILTGVDDQAAPVIFPTELIPRDST